MQNALAAFVQPIRSVAEYAAEYDQADIRKQGMQRNALLLQQSQAEMADRQRAQREGETLRNALAALGAGATPEARINAMEGTGLPQGFSQADALRKTLIEQQKGQATIAKDTAEAEQKRYALTRTKLEHGVQWLQVAQTPQQAQQMFADGVRKGYWGMQDAQQQAQSIPQDPAQFQQWKQTQLAQILDAAKLLPTVQTRNTGGSTDTLAVNPLTGVPTVTGSVKNTQSPESVASERTAAAARAQSADQFNRRLAYDQGKDATAAAGGGKQGPMSVTLQKELLESDDVAQSSAAVIGTLTQAKAINDKAYSGYLAKPRATLRSNLPGESESADATINLDNMMTGQALESLKVTFGAAPTEGERKILMDMQASADKTPTQRKDIIDRAIAAAKRRGEYANRKAEAIRSGKYLTEGIPQPAAASPAPASGPAVGSVVDGYRFKGGNPADKANWEKQ